LNFWNKVKFVFSLIGLIFGVIFSTLNWNSLEVHLIFTKMNLPLTVVLLFAFIIGIAFANLMHFQRQRKKDKEQEQHDDIENT
jgi:uncharacterized integral membrane protein